METQLERDKLADFEIRKLLLQISKNVTKQEFKDMCFLSKSFGVGDGELEDCKFLYELFSLLERKNFQRVGLPSSGPSSSSLMEGVLSELLKAIQRNDLVRELEKHYVRMMIYSLITDTEPSMDVKMQNLCGSDRQERSSSNLVSGTDDPSPRGLIF